MDFSYTIIDWYNKQKRDLPWRNTKNPYCIWLSEIMLQQTRVAQALPYYEKFINTFPTVFDLANAPEEQVLKLWQGLGYYSRARNMHKTAQYIANNCNGIFPDNYASLLKLKGIGSYTAAAVASIAFKERVPVVDGNVYRVLSRYFGIPTDISLNSAKKEFTEIAQKLMDKHNPCLFNQAVMEFGALQCVPKSPACKSCVLADSCVAFQKNEVHLYPVKNKKVKVTHRYFNYIVFIDSQNKTIINKRTEKGIWHNLYEFPVLETNDEVTFNEICTLISQKFKDLNPKFIKPYNNKTIVHKLSHQTLHIRFYKAETDVVLNNSITIESMKQYPFPIVIHNFIEKYLF